MDGTGYEPFDPPYPGASIKYTAQGSIFADGVPDEVEASHIVMGTQNHYISMGYSSTSRIVVLGIIFIVLFVILLVAFGIYFSGTKAKIELVVPDPINYIPTINQFQGRGPNQTISFKTANDGLGLSSPLVCSNNPRMIFNETVGTCGCASPYWSGNCQRESYKPQYIATGKVNPGSITITPIGSPVVTNQLSYPVESSTISCTDLCDATNNCTGVIWEPIPIDDNHQLLSGVCTLFSQVVVNPSYHINYNPLADSNIFVKDNLSAIKFTDRVLIYSGSLPPRWWTNIRQALIDSNHIIVVKGRVYNLTFYPEHAFNSTPMTGLYSLTAFTTDQFVTLVTAGNDATHYIVAPGDPLNVPLSWYSQPIWVMYDII